MAITVTKFQSWLCDQIIEIPTGWDVVSWHWLEDRTTTSRHLIPPGPGKVPKSLKSTFHHFPSFCMRLMHHQSCAMEDRISILTTPLPWTAPS
jgi:hypothetical protein